MSITCQGLCAQWEDWMEQDIVIEEIFSSWRAVSMETDCSDRDEHDLHK